MTPRHGSRADGFGSMATPARLDAEPHPQILSRSDSAYGSTVQSQILYTGTADSLLDAPDAGVDPSYPYQQLDSKPGSDGTLAFQDSQYPSASPDLSHLRTAEWPNGTLDSSPWFPGLRIDQQLASGPPDFQHTWPLFSVPESLEDFNQELQTVDESQYSVPITDTSELIIDPFHANANATTTKDITTCVHCGKTFTGKYQRGNYARHVKQYHSGVVANETERTCRRCNKLFKRPDARRKHEWLAHGLSDSEPCPRKPASSQHDDNHSEEVDLLDAGMQLKRSPSLSTLGGHAPRDVFAPPYRVPDHSENAYETFANLHTQMDVAFYRYFCETMIARWEQIVEAFRLQGSDAYGPFAHVLEDLSTSLRPLQHPKSSASGVDAEEIPDTRANHAKIHSRPTSHTHRGKGRAHRSTSRATSRKSTSRPGQPSTLTDNPGSEAIATTAEILAKEPRKKVDCPVYKYFTMVLRRKAPCGGCRQEFMSQIRHHLRSSEKHREFIALLRHCDRCHEEVVERHHADGSTDQAWIGGNHAAGTCIKRDGPPETLITCWARLYLAIFPWETRVPSPYTNEPGWLSDETVEPLLPAATPLLPAAPLFPAALQAPMQPQGLAPVDSSSIHFLGYRQLDYQQAQPQDSFAPNLNTTDGVPYRAAESTILNDILNAAARILADDHAQRVLEPRPPEEVIAEYRARIEDLRWQPRIPSRSGSISNQLPRPSLNSVPAMRNQRNLSFGATTQSTTQQNSSSLTSFIDSSPTSWSHIPHSTLPNHHQQQSFPMWDSMATIGPQTLVDPTGCPPPPGFAFQPPDPPQAMYDAPSEIQTPNLPIIEDNFFGAQSSSHMPGSQEFWNQEPSMQSFAFSFNQPLPSPTYPQPDAEEDFLSQSFD